MKKLFAIILLGVMLAGIGCTPKKTEQTTGQGGTGAAEQNQNGEEQKTDDVLDEG